MAYLPVDFPVQTVAGFAPIAFAPPLAAPGASAVAALASARPQLSLLTTAVLPALPQATGGGGGSVGYPH